MLAYQPIGYVGYDGTFTPAPGTDDTVPTDTRGFLWVKNTGGVSRTVTVTVPGTSFSQPLPDVAINVPAGTETLIGPLPPGLGALVSVNYSSAAGISAAAVRLPFAGETLGFPDWVDLADWEHSWDMAHAQLVDGRAVNVTDRSGNRPLRLMPGEAPLLGADIDIYGPLPGPIWLPSSPRFNGRPALVCDRFPTVGSAFPLFAGLTPNTDGVTGTEDSDNFFNAPNGYPQPYWVAVLGRIGLPDAVGGTDEDPAGIWDAQHGDVGTGPTIGRKIVGIGAPNWQVSNFGPGLVLITAAHTATANETVLVLCCVNGASSFLEVTWRDAAGTLLTLRQTGTLLAWNYLECFAGWVHGPYLSAAGIGLGVPDEADLDLIRAWSARWIPPARSLPSEPS